VKPIVGQTGESLFLLHHMLGVRPTLRLVRHFSVTQSLARMTPLSKSEKEWRAILSPEQFRILRQKGTERAGTGQYNKHYEPGLYHCAGCDAPLYKSTTKFNSGCGWPAFFDAIPGAIDRHDDFSFGMVCTILSAYSKRRTEITCKNCGGHLGHVFYGEGFPTPTDERHCVNSISLSLYVVRHIINRQC